ncbi:MAG TPA: cyclic nucleotide-binding and patatin-like phospholipase domain-containing protein [Myxococcaceae bacterium]|nr:cyclic nucleotide-binding and patatin-like phospholipase domain-containing protein [Myxococcaceae bacterium]
MAGTQDEAAHASQELSRLLSRMPLFEALRPSDLRELASRCRPRWLEDGAYLFHEGEAADRFYVLVEGHLDVVRPGPDGRAELRLNSLSPGATVGELAIVRGETRSASVRAVGRARVYGLEAQAFLEFLRRFPELALGIARLASEAMIRAERRSLAPARTPLWTVLRAERLGPDFGLSLARAAVRYLDFETRPRGVTVFAPGAGSREESLRQTRLRILPLEDASAGTLAERVNAARAASALVVVAGPESQVAALLPRTSAVLSVSPSRPASLPEASAWIRMIPSGMPSATTVRFDAPDPAGRVARLLLGRAVGLALGGGAALGLAHVGVLQALDEMNVPVDFVTGTSMGAAMGAFYLSIGVDRMTQSMDQLTRPMDWALNLMDAASLSRGMASGDKVQKWAEANVLETFDRLATPFAAVATDIDTWDEVILREGRLGEALRASTAIPGVFLPHLWRSAGSARRRRLADGGSINNVPVDVARAMGAHRVIGVHVIPRQGGLPAEARRQGLTERLLDQVPAVARLRSVVQAQFIAMSRSGERQVFTSDVAILPNTRAFRLSDFWKGPEIAQTGRRAALDVADQLRVLAP